jgi:hypothetical protein
MSTTKPDAGTPSRGRSQWLDEATDSPLVHEYGIRLSGFLEAMADGKIEKHELKQQEERLVELMKRVEPKLDDEQHEEVTQLLCELTAYNIMMTLHGLMENQPKTRFRG